MVEKTSLANGLNITNEGKEKLKRTVEFLIGGEVKSFDRDTLMEDLGVVDIVRMQPDDFPKIDPNPGSVFSHFNLEKSPNRPREADESERKYLIVRIQQTGTSTKEPVLSLDGALLAECLEAQSNLSYDALTADQLERSLESMRDILSLQDEMVKRYGKSRDLSRQEIIDRGLGYTLFRILGPAPASHVVR